MSKRTKLKSSYYKIKLKSWKEQNTKATPSLEYVETLENIIIKFSDDNDIDRADLKDYFNELFKNN